MEIETTKTEKISYRLISSFAFSISVMTAHIVNLNIILFNIVTFLLSFYTVLTSSLSLPETSSSN